MSICHPSFRMPSSPRSPRTTPSKSPLSKNVHSPLKVIFRPRNCLSDVKTEKLGNGKSDLLESKDDQLVLNKTPKKRCIGDDCIVMQLDEFKLKVRRSTRLLRSTSSDQYGSVYVAFPTYKDESHSIASWANPRRYAITFSLISIIIISLLSSSSSSIIIINHHHHHHYHYLLLPVTPPLESGTDPEASGSPASCLKEVTESPTLNPLCYPNSYWAEL